jgi:hypothetical protein
MKYIYCNNQISYDIDFDLHLSSIHVFWATCTQTRSFLEALHALKVLNGWTLYCFHRAFSVWIFNMKHIVIIIIIIIFLVMEYRWNEIDRGDRNTRGKPVPVPLCPQQIPRALTRDRTQASALAGRRLTAWAMARPLNHKLHQREHCLRIFICYFISLWLTI